MKNQFLMVLIAIVLCVSCNSATNNPASNPITTSQPNVRLIVSAAASLTDALKEIATLYRQVTVSTTVNYNFASSGALQQQIEQGAPADVFISAAEKQINSLVKKDLLLAETRRSLLSNRLVLITPKDTNIHNLASLTDGTVNRIAIGDPRSVPAGQYAEQVLRQQNLWKSLQPKLVLANNVRQVLQFVGAGNAEAGLVYLTDAKTAEQIKIVATIDPALHSPIVYPIAVIKTSKNPVAATAYVNFLSDQTAKQVFQKYGFITN